MRAQGNRRAAAGAAGDFHGKLPATQMAVFMPTRSMERHAWPQEILKPNGVPIFQKAATSPIPPRRTWSRLSLV